MYGSTGAGGLGLDLYAPPLDRSRQALMALAAGIAALLGGLGLLIWAATHWIVSPLRPLNAAADAIAGGERVASPPSSRIAEVGNVAAAIDGMAEALAQAAQRDTELDERRRFLVSAVAHDLRTPLFSLRGYLDAIVSGIGRPDDHLDRAREGNPTRSAGHKPFRLRPNRPGR